eukprot:TRINITY_DN2892_c0_g2_i5.p1 TRINITY_DN2892_c0_g2~~TRINITY_DN2892_c0_g2_i5.p1  ORF type:complete len:322 (+),score=61.59 TRINITY_DN2892_c0_g2_i5:143-1108(+)
MNRSLCVLDLKCEAEFKRQLRSPSSRPGIGSVPMPSAPRLSEVSVSSDTRKSSEWALNKFGREFRRMNDLLQRYNRTTVNRRTASPLGDRTGSSFASTQFGLGRSVERFPRSQRSPSAGQSSERKSFDTINFLSNVDLRARPRKEPHEDEKRREWRERQRSFRQRNEHYQQKQQEASKAAEESRLRRLSDRRPFEHRKRNSLGKSPTSKAIVHKERALFIKFFCFKNWRAQVKVNQEKNEKGRQFSRRRILKKAFRGLQMAKGMVDETPLLSTDRSSRTLEKKDIIRGCLKSCRKRPFGQLSSAEKEEMWSRLSSFFQKPR